jgi:arabinose-5-phosphate isomerase
MNKQIIIKSAQEAIKNEISGIKKLSTIIDDNFSKILVKLSKVKGKIIFTGIGKSAHIAKKYRVL